jgi:hypothetical protein
VRYSAITPAVAAIVSKTNNQRGGRRHCRQVIHPRSNMVAVADITSQGESRVDSGKNADNAAANSHQVWRWLTGRLLRAI